MDNLCHTLTGAAFAEAGLKRQTRFGSAALMIAANLPDVDVLAFFSDYAAGRVPTRLDTWRARAGAAAGAAHRRARSAR